MLTPEQIENLKPGDNLLLEAFFVEKDGDNIKFTLEPTYVPGSKVFSASPYSLRFLCGADRTFCHVVDSMVKPEHDPCRPFKAGDIVTPQRINGRSYDDIVRKKEGLLFRVVHDETSAHIISIKNEEDKHYINPAFLLLITPVEEIEPFGVRYSTDRDCAEVYHRRYKNTVAAFYCKCGITREQAEAHAEAEAARLNAKSRKEQK